MQRTRPPAIGSRYTLQFHRCSLLPCKPRTSWSVVAALLSFLELRHRARTIVFALVFKAKDASLVTISCSRAVQQCASAIDSFELFLCSRCNISWTSFGTQSSLSKFTAVATLVKRGLGKVLAQTNLRSAAQAVPSNASVSNMFKFQGETFRRRRDCDLSVNQETAGNCQDLSWIQI